MINVSRMGVWATYLNLYEAENVEPESEPESNYTDGGEDLPYESRAIIHL